MKKAFTVMITIFVVLIIIITVNVKNAENVKKELEQFNKEYEYYLGKQIHGAELTTLINKAIENNKKNGIKQDDEGYFINDNKYYIEIELKMITVPKTFKMEQIHSADVIEFIKNFNVVKFECTKIEYHKETGRASKLVFEELQGAY